MSRNLILLIMCIGKINNTYTTENDYKKVDHRIVGGHGCPVADHKYMVAILFGDEFHCGGSLLSSRWVLTARHCMEGSEDSDYTVVAGVEASSKQYWGKYMQSSVVKSRYEHPTDDIGLIHLQKSIKVSPVVGYVTLATYVTMMGRKLEDICSNSTIVGWGLQNVLDPSGWSDPHLQCVTNVRVLSPQECYKRLASDGRLNVTAWNFCAIKEGADSCKGDSGGPLLCNGIQYGIVSYGHGCGYEDLPKVFLKVFYFESFIQATMRKGNGNISQNRSCSAFKHSFLVAIIHQSTVKSYNWEWECAGSLLTKIWVLTSGFCMLKCETPSYYTVVAGLNDSFHFDPNDNRTISSKVVQCLQSPYQNEIRDIALMKLKHGIRPSQKVSFIRIATLLDLKNKHFEKVCSNGTLIGYGWPNRPLFHNLQCDKMRITTDKQCKKIWASSKIGDRHGCIDGPSGDCYGILGVPLVCHGIQYGVLSSIDCTGRRNPNSVSYLIAKVYKYSEFLQKMVYGINYTDSQGPKSSGNMKNPVYLYIFISFLFELIILYI